MEVEAFKSLDGRVGRDFVIIDRTGMERFAARLHDGSATLNIHWTDDLPATPRRLREAQRLAGGPDAFSRIEGVASDRLESAIRSGRFAAERAANLLSRSLGGRWSVQVKPRSGSPGLFNVFAERVEGSG